MPPAENGTSRLVNLKHMFRSLRGRNYALFFFGQGVSVVGTWMQTTALAMLVYVMTDSKWMLGVVGFASAIFSFLVAPIAGVFTDRWNRRSILLVTQSLALLQAAILAALTLTHTLQIGHILALAFFSSLINAVDVPNRQSFVVQMVDRREDLPNAIALNSFLFNGARLIGPVLAGVVVAFLGRGGLLPGQRPQFPCGACRGAGDENRAADAHRPAKTSPP